MLDAAARVKTELWPHVVCDGRPSLRRSFGTARGIVALSQISVTSG